MRHGIVYHARLETHISTAEGYIGITSQRFKTRISQHKTNAFHLKSTYKSSTAFRKYWDELIWEVLFEGTYEECRELERKLRPQPNMGWNTVVGGQDAHVTMFGKVRPEHSEWCKVNGFQKGNVPVLSQLVYCDGFIFENMCKASIVLNCNRKTIFNRVKNPNFTNYYYLDRE